MFKLIALLAAGATLYTMGHHAAQASTTGAAEAKPAAWEQVATVGGTWIARQIHEQTAWAAQAPKADDQTANSQAGVTVTLAAS